ncbi:unnamed protein product [Moneuplotes crassus]|uniref:Uncharacterized protein n=1 Tax=Euplotes crassus TaxID=5936 RepID=A0AAD1Y8U4_EUPCR|nr:unnamed protein product [Moneuplotes crassus]
METFWEREQKQQNQKLLDQEEFDCRDDGIKHGLFDKTHQSEVPLFCVETKIKIHNNIAEIKFLQYYFNDKDEDIQAEYILPIDTSCIFTRFKAYVGDEVLKAHVQENKRIEDALNSAGYKKTNPSCSPFSRQKDIMSIQMGDLPPNSPVIISCVFHQVMVVEDISWRLHIPSIIHPKYFGDLTGAVKCGANLEEMIKNIDPEIKGEMQEKHVERISSLYSSNEHLWGLAIVIYSQSPITRIISPSHQIKASFLDEDNQVARVDLENPKTKDFFSRDFKLMYRNQDINIPSAIVQKKGDFYALMVCMLADCTHKKDWDETAVSICEEIDTNPDTKYKQKLENTDPPQYTFIIDCSDSMKVDNRIDIAKEALILYLRSLPCRCEFNVLCFGSNHSFLLSSYQPYSDESMEKAIRRVKKLSANMGTTEFYSCLKALFSNEDPRSLQNNVILLTDGCVSDLDECIEIVQENSANFTLNTFGIGSRVNPRSLVSLSKAGNGEHYIIDNACTSLKKDIINCLSSSLCDEINILRKDIAVSGNKIFEYPPLDEIETTMAHGSQFTYFCIIDTKGKDFRGSISFDVQEKKDEEIEDILLDLQEDVKHIPGDSIFKMFCDTYIRENSKYELTRKDIISISLRFQVISEYTSLILIGPDMRVRKVLKDGNSSSGSPHASLKNSKITVFAEIPRGLTISMDCYEDTLIEHLWRYLDFQEGITPDSYQLSYEGLLLQERRSLADYGIQDGALLYCDIKPLEEIYPIVVDESISEITLDELLEMQSYDGSWEVGMFDLADYNWDLLRRKLPIQIRDTITEPNLVKIGLTIVGLQTLTKFFPSHSSLKLITQKSTALLHSASHTNLSPKSLSSFLYWA